MATTNKRDIDFFYNSNDGYWDLALTDEGDLVGSNSIDTAVLMSLFTDKRADKSEIRKATQRRGWVGNLFNNNENYEIGSKIWIHSNQGRMQADNLNNIVDDAKDSLNWLLEDGIVDQMVIDYDTINNNEIKLNLRFVIGENIIELNYVLWRNSRWQ